MRVPPFEGLHFPLIPLRLGRHKNVTGPEAEQKFYERQNEFDKVA